MNWMNVHCALATLIQRWHWTELMLDTLFFLSCHNNTANWNFASVYFWNNLNVNARYEQKRPATASTTKVLNTHIHVLALTSLLRKTLSSKCFFLLFYFVAEAFKRVLLSNAFPLALSQISEHGQVCIYLRAFWHNFANFMWKRRQSFYRKLSANVFPWNELRIYGVHTRPCISTDRIQF